MTQLKDQFGRLDYLVNCAGTTLSGELATLPLADWHSVIDLNLNGPFHVARAAFPLLAAQAGSAVVNIGTIASAGAYPGGGGYAASKAALLVLTRPLAVEWAVHGIRVTDRTSELQSLMRISYAVFCLKKKKISN